ncbi:MAG: hypothetical protein KA233_12575 [Novosphingobium sp.]|nr:hypothetical protein [Novosphingobium sp.]MBP6556504.1 hypothetical protein [Novosphingobium sp.]
MNPFTFIKNTIRAAGCLIIFAVMAGGSLVSYVESNPDRSGRMAAIGWEAEQRVDRDAGFIEKVGALISAWWDSDELVAEAQQDKALEEESKEKREARERERRFNDSQYREGDDYYGSSS